MKATHNILITVIIILSVFIPGSAQTYLPTVCPGNETAKYVIVGSEGSTFTWTFPRGIQPQFNNETVRDTVTVNWSEIKPGEYDVSVVEISKHHCTGFPFEAKIVVTETKSIFTEDRINICKGETFVIDPGAYSTYHWNNGSTDRKFTASESGWVKLTVNENEACSIQDSVYVVINSLPNPEIYDIETDSAHEITPCNVSYPKFATTRVTYDFYEWSTGDIGSQIEVGPVDSTRILWVKVTDANGCAEYDSILVKSCGVDEILEGIPNAFNPKDPIQNYWNISDQISQFPGARVEVFDR